MTEKNVSLYKETLRNMEAFLKGLDIHASQIVCQGLVTTVNRISDYHETNRTGKHDEVSNR